MRNAKWIIFSISFFLVLSVAVNARLYVLWSSAHDEVYDMINKSYINDQQILSELDRGNVRKASDMLRREIEISGDIVAICVIEECSKSMLGIDDE